MNEGIDIRDVQNVELEILKKTVCVFEKYNLRYLLAYGTLIGAARHKGFIPWDDDIDIMMPREDYEKFRKIANSELESPLFFQDFTTDSGYPSTTAKVRNSNTAMIEQGYKRI